MTSYAGKIIEEKRSAVKVAIADDHELFLKIYTLTLESAGMEVCCTASDGREMLDSIQKHQPDILLLDIAMPKMDGLAALTILKYLAPEMPILVISYMTDPAYQTRALELGADGYLSKGVSPQELIDAVQTILSGERLSPETGNRTDASPPSMPGLVFPKEDPASPAEEDLTDQEKLILSLIAMGNDNHSIMEMLHISKNTLKTHTRNLYAKLGVSDRTQAAIWAIQHGYDFSAP